jgi:hypothetical protein
MTSFLTSLFARSKPWRENHQEGPTTATATASNAHYFLTLLKKTVTTDEWAKIVNQDKVFVCCPPPIALDPQRLTSKTMKTHVLRTVSEEHGTFQTWLGQSVDLVGTHIFLGKGFPHPGRKIKVFHIDQCSLSSPGTEEVVRVLLVSQSLTGGIYAPEALGDIGGSLAIRYVAALRWYPALEPVLADLNRFLRDVKALGRLTAGEGFHRLRPSLLAILRRQWAQTSAMLLCATCTLGIHQHSSGNDSFSIHEFSDDHLQQVVESFMFKRCANHLYRHVVTLHRRENTAFLHCVEALREQHASYFKIAPHFLFVSQEEAMHTLRSLRDVYTPVDKLKVMRQTVQAIHDTLNKVLLGHADHNRKEQENSETAGERDSNEDCLPRLLSTSHHRSQSYSSVSVDELRVSWQQDLASRNKTLKPEDIEFSTDDLISVLIWVIVQASDCEGLSDRRPLLLPSDLHFSRDWHFCADETSDTAFVQCHFEVALDWILSQDLIAVVIPATTPTTSTTLTSEDLKEDVVVVD